MIDFSRFTHLTFDCYGTLIDWENGILNALMPLLKRHGVEASAEEVLRLYIRLEAEQESGSYQPYRDVLRGVMDGFANHLRFDLGASERDLLGESIARWQPFPDTVEALRWLKTRYRLVIVSNIDDALFASTARLLEVPFDDAVTAQQARSYKPAPENFHLALRRLGVPASQVLHVAQSLYHDHVPARRLGFTTVWVNRASRLPGRGLALPAEGRPNLEVPDLRTLVEKIGGLAAAAEKQK